jgi:hypothetical protein
VDHLVGFILECFAFGRDSKAERGNTYGCIFAILGAFAVVMLVAVLAIWVLLKP